MDEIWSLIRAIVFENILDSLCILKRQDTPLKEQAAFRHKRIT